MILTSRNVDKHPCNVVLVIQLPVLLILFKILSSHTLYLVTVKNVASLDFNRGKFFIQFLLLIL
jgi:hypothetical protein